MKPFCSGKLLPPLEATLLAVSATTRGESQRATFFSLCKRNDGDCFAQLKEFVVAILNEIISFARKKCAKDGHESTPLDAQKKVSSEAMISAPTALLRITNRASWLPLLQEISCRGQGYMMVTLTNKHATHPKYYSKWITSGPLANWLEYYVYICDIHVSMTCDGLEALNCIQFKYTLNDIHTKNDLSLGFVFELWSCLVRWGDNHKCRETQRLWDWEETQCTRNYKFRQHNTHSKEVRSRQIRSGARLERITKSSGA